MTNRTILLALALAPSIGGCAQQEGGEAAASAREEGLIRTANPYARGLTDADFPRVQQIAEGVYTYEQLHATGGEKVTTVSMFVVTSDGVLVADGQENVEETRRLVDAIAEITEQPITHVVIGADHGDHTDGNSAFPSSAAFLAHPTSAATLRTKASRPDRPADAPPVVLPTELVADSLTLSLGGREIRILHLGRAHTGGDLLVHLPDEKILFMSETFLNRVFPALVTAYPSENVEVLRRAQAMDIDLYVPGHGFVDPPQVLEEELENYRRAIEQALAEGGRLHTRGLPLDEAIEAARFGDLETWTLRASQGPTAIRRVYAELNGELPEP